MIRKDVKCPNCGWKGFVDCYTYSENVYCPECCELIEGAEECYCTDCHWNEDNYCIIPDDDQVTFGEDCPYRGKSE